MWEIENALREDHLPELLDLEGEKGWVRPLTEFGELVEGHELIEAWRAEGCIRFQSAPLREGVPSSVLWVSAEKLAFAPLSLRDVSFVRHNDKVLVQAMLSKDEV